MTWHNRSWLETIDVEVIKKYRGLPSSQIIVAFVFEVLIAVFSVDSCGNSSERTFNYKSIGFELIYQQKNLKRSRFQRLDSSRDLSRSSPSTYQDIPFKVSLDYIRTMMNRSYWREKPAALDYERMRLN
jgi:hypothetical protein